MVRKKPPFVLRVLKYILIGIVLAELLTLTHSSWLSAIGRWINIQATPNLHQADAIIVHGGNHVRTLYGIELYQRGLAPKFWHLGYAFDESNITASVVPPIPRQSFTFLPSTSTWTDGTQIAATIRAQNLHSVIIVTDWWHSRRAVCSTEQQLNGYSVNIAFEPSPSPAGPSNWWQDMDIRADVESELIKMIYYAFRYGMRPWGC